MAHFLKSIVPSFLGVVLCIVSSFSQGISEDIIERALRGIRDGTSYNDIINERKVVFPPVGGNSRDMLLSDEKSLAMRETVQDQRIDPDNYYVGPGDVFLVYIWGKVEKTFYLTINNEGKIILPLSGVIEVGNKTITELRNLIKPKIQAMYNYPVNINIILHTIRTFKTYINGKVVTPGPYVVNGVTRVSDVINYAGGIILAQDTLIGRCRGITIENDLFGIRYADLAIFNNAQDISKNPYLREGDRILIEPRHEIVSIKGFINYPGTYDYCNDDKAADIVTAAGGFSRGADKDRIIVYRFVNNIDSLMTFELSEQQLADFKLEKDDRILVCGIPDYRKHLDVIVKGEVKYPGMYPIREDKTRLVDIIAMAGGLTEHAFLKGSKIVRKYYANIGDREFERVKSMPAFSLTPMERSYLKMKLVEEDGIVSIDFEELMKHGSDLYNILLKDKDEITIARKSLSIKVSGAVVSPGLVSVKEGAEPKYYIEQAGGFNTRAKKRSLMIIKGGTEIMLKPSKVKKLEAGDAIWVPEKEYVNGAQLTKDILLILSSVATVLISIFTIRELAK